MFFSWHSLESGVMPTVRLSPYVPMWLAAAVPDSSVHEDMSVAIWSLSLQGLLSGWGDRARGTRKQVPEKGAATSGVGGTPGALSPGPRGSEGLVLLRGDGRTFPGPSQQPVVWSGGVRTGSLCSFA